MKTHRKEIKKLLLGKEIIVRLDSFKLNRVIGGGDTKQAQPGTTGLGETSNSAKTGPTG